MLIGSPTHADPVGSTADPATSSSRFGANDSVQDDISQANESEGAACGRALETHPSAAKAAFILGTLWHG